MLVILELNQFGHQFTSRRSTAFDIGQDRVTWEIRIPAVVVHNDYLVKELIKLLGKGESNLGMVHHDQERVLSDHQLGFFHCQEVGAILHPQALDGPGNVW